MDCARQAYDSELATETGLFRASVSAELAPCFRAFLLPLGGPPAARASGRAEGARRWSPLRFDLAWHLRDG
jgi:hypothetical protein